MTDQIETPEIKPVEAVEEKADLYHNPVRLSRISTWANILSWISLVTGTAFFVMVLVSIITSVVNFGGQVGVMDLLPSILNGLIFFVLGGFIFVLLQALAEGIYLFMDIEDNTRRK